MTSYRRELSVAGAYLLLLLILYFRAPGFFVADTARDLCVNNIPVLVAAVGMTLVILSRQIDISIGSQYSLAAVVAGLLAAAGAPMPFVFAGALLAGAGMGAVNGVLIALFGLPSIVVTLATLMIGRELLRLWREGEAVAGLPESFQWFGAGQAYGQWLVVAIGILIFLAFAWCMRHVRAGRAVYATGSDYEAARLAGLRPRYIVFGVFVLMGVLAGLAGVLDAVRFPTVDAKLGDGKEMQVIAAVVVGGTAVSGGRGRLLGTLLGVALLGTVSSALLFLHVPSAWVKAAQGGFILFAVASDALFTRTPRQPG